jgi:hypothetical protein
MFTDAKKGNNLDAYRIKPRAAILQVLNLNPLAVVPHNKISQLLLYT